MELEALGLIRKGRGEVRSLFAFSVRKASWERRERHKKEDP